MQGDKRRYYRFRFAKFYGGIVTADATRCNLLCAYCWNYSRNLNPSKAEKLFSPIEVAEKLLAISQKHKCHQFRISGLSQSLARHRLCTWQRSSSLQEGFIVETDGIAIGFDPSLLDHLTERRQMDL